MGAKAVAAVVGSHQDMLMVTEAILIKKFGIAYYPITHNNLTLRQLEQLATIGLDFMIIDNAGSAGPTLIKRIRESKSLIS